MNPRPLLLLLAAALGHAGDLSLPPAPVRLVVPDVQAFDAALTGGLRRFATGKPKPGDPVMTAWRASQVGSKLEDQWSRFSAGLPLAWDDLRKLQATALGLAILEVGHLEAVLAVETPLAVLPASFPKGERRTHGGVAYTLVAKGAADPGSSPERRMGLAYARSGTQLLVATSERALKLALDAAQAGRGFAPPLPGLASLELDLDALRKDRFFRREFLFDAGPDRGLLRAALRKDGEDLVEVREGAAEGRAPVPAFAAPGAAAAGWEPEGSPLWPALRRALLDPVPAPPERPVPALKELPAPAAEGAEDRYGIDLRRPGAAPGDAPWELGDLATWNTLLKRVPVAHWGYWIGPGGVRRMVLPWPAAEDAAFLEACRASLARRGGPVTLVRVGEAQELRLGGAFPALALRRTGAYLWLAASAKDLEGVSQPGADAGLVRWARVDLAAVRAEGARWSRIEGPARPERVRPLSDRVLGLLGWMPATTAISAERRRKGGGWVETVRFSAGK